ncbi:MAG: molybdopterin oxidoreductase [Saprospiraceae bacterium]|nr:MAG: molybdopterin oxidoreductase [Saprospiraceae bacterium]
MKKTGIIILAVFALIGFYTIGLRFSEGLQTTHLNAVFWGEWVAFYIYCIGLSAGSFLMSTLIYVFGMHQFEKMGRLALLSAFVALLSGLTFVWIDLGHPWRFYKMFTHWNHTSVLAWESMFYIFYTFIILAELYMLMRHDLATLRENSIGRKKSIYKFFSLGWRIPSTEEGQAQAKKDSMKWVKILGVIGLPVAIGVHGGTGALFAVVAAKPYWFSGLFPIIFLVSALVSGCGLMLLLYSMLGDKDEDYIPMLKGIRGFLVLFIGIDILLFISDMLVGSYGAIPEHTAIWHRIMFGNYWYVFWIGQIFMAWLLPMLICSLRSIKDKANWMALAGLFTVIGIVNVRFNLVIPAYTEPQLPGLDIAFSGHPRLSYDYFPNFVEWFSSFGIFAFMILVFLALWTLLPVNESISRGMEKSSLAH